MSGLFKSMHWIGRQNLARTFGEKLSEAFEAKGQLCVGIDPHSNLLNAWGVGDSVAGLREFSLRVVDAAGNSVSIVKPQVSFYERFGAKGFEVLAEVTQSARSQGLLVIADAKRGDIGTTMQAYLEAWFGEKSGLYADALTTSPYLGLGATTESFDKWTDLGKGIFSLVATSNTQGESVQLASISGSTLASNQFDQLASLNASLPGKIGSFGAVIGATLDLGRFGINMETSKTPILAPGFGAQGAELSNASRIFHDLTNQVVFSVSRSVLEVGAAELSSAIASARSELNSGLSK